MAIVAEDVETVIKVIVVGNGGVGKTSMIARFCKGVYTETYKKTIGVDFLEREHYVESLGESVRMMVWDTAGQEEFDTLTRQYYRGAGACVLVFSTTDRASFDAIPQWKAKVTAECGEGLQMVIVQNKVDLLHQAVVTPAEAEDMSKRLGLRFYRSCVKENSMVTEVFEYLAESFVKLGGHRRAAASGPGDEETLVAGGGGAQVGQLGSLGGVGAPGSIPGQRDVRAAGATQSNAPFKIDRGVIRRTGGKKALKCLIA